MGGSQLYPVVTPEHEAICKASGGFNQSLTDFKDAEGWPEHAKPLTGVLDLVRTGWIIDWRRAIAAKALAQLILQAAPILQAAIKPTCSISPGPCSEEFP